jgi:hypothetical protein
VPIVEDMQKVHGRIFVDILGLLGVDEIPGPPDIGVRDVDGGVKVGKRRKRDLTMAVMVGGVYVLVCSLVCGRNVPVKVTSEALQSKHKRKRIALQVYRLCHRSVFPY